MRRYDWLDISRFLALWLILLYHWFGNLVITVPSFFIFSPKIITIEFGFMGVMLFFFISSFAITVNFEKYQNNLRAYYIKRLSRLYVSYWLAVVLAIFITVYTSVQIFNLNSPLFFWLQNLTLLRLFGNNINGIWVGYFNPVWWFLFVLMQFYIVFPFVYPLIKKYYFKTILPFGGLYILLYFFSKSFELPLLAGYLLPLYLGLMVGLYYKGKEVVPKNNYLYSIVSLLLLLVGLLISPTTQRGLILGPISYIGLFGIVLFTANIKPGSAIRSLNKIGMEVYLVHNMTIALVVGVVSQYLPGRNVFLYGFGPFLLATLFLSLLIYYPSRAIHMAIEGRLGLRKKLVEINDFDIIEPTV